MNRRDWLTTAAVILVGAWCGLLIAWLLVEVFGR